MVYELFTVVLVAAGLSLGLNRLMLAFAPRWGLMDVPNETRRIHTTPIPRAGGIAIWLTFLIVAVAVMLIPGWAKGVGNLSWRWLSAFAAGSAILIAAGVVDDSRGLSPWVKLGCHAIAPTLFYLIHPMATGLFPEEWPMVLSYVIFLVWSVVLINAFNLIDGLDGLCGGLAAVSTFALGGLALANGRTDAAVLLLAMGGAILGFLRYNLNPARIFLGDAGSMLMGFFLATAATDAVGRKAVAGMVLLPIAVAGVPLLDVLLAIWRRGARRLVRQLHGEEIQGGIFAADRDHLHHRLLDGGSSQRRVAAILQGIAIVLALLAFLPLMFGDRVLSLSLVGFLVVGLLAVRHLARVEMEHTGSVIHMAIKLPGHRRRVAGWLFLYDILVLAISATAAVTMETNFLTTGGDMNDMLRFVLVFTMLGSVCLLVVQVHHRLWVRATMRDVLSLQFWLMVGAVGTFSFFSVIYTNLDWSALRLTLMSYTLSCFFVCLPRVLLDLMREFGFDARHSRRKAGSTPNDFPVAVIGAGDLGTLLLEHLKSTAGGAYPGLRILGFLDESRVLHGRRLRSFRILGSVDSIPKLVHDAGLKGLVLAIQNPTSELMEKIDGAVEEFDLKVIRWSVALENGG